ncbi:MAG: ammonium transporter [Methanobacteriaceae archaeon]
MDIFSSGDTAWVLMATILVLIMTIPGIALFYGGLVKKKNLLNTMFLSLISFAIGTIIWIAFGYQLAFGSDVFGFIGNYGGLFLSGISTDSLSNSIPELVFIGFQLTFATLTVALISGAVVERIKFSSWILFVIAWIPLVYIPIAHWVWGGGWLYQLGALDFAGGTVVHISSGVSALVLAIVLGKRKDTSLLPHNLGYSVIGAALLWFGWMGFNAGSGLMANGLAGSALIVSNVAAAAGLISWVAIEWIKDGKATVLGAISGAIAGLVAITPAAGFVDSSAAIIIGILGSAFAIMAIAYIKPKLGYDDALDVFGIHGVCGIWGAIATGIFAIESIGGATGLMTGNLNQFLVQILSVSATVAYAGIMTFLIAKLINKVIGLRVTDKEEIEGLDTHLHEETGYRI